VLCRAIVVFCYGVLVDDHSSDRDVCHQCSEGLRCQGLCCLSRLLVMLCCMRCDAVSIDDHSSDPDITNVADCYSVKVVLSLSMACDSVSLMCAMYCCSFHVFCVTLS
jgi:hypothetical protein